MRAIDITRAVLVVATSATLFGTVLAAAPDPTETAATAAPASDPSQAASTGQPGQTGQPGTRPPGSPAPARGQRSFRRCLEIAKSRKLHGAERRHYVARCRLGHGLRLFR